MTDRLVPVEPQDDAARDAQAVARLGGSRRDLRTVAVVGLFAIAVLWLLRSAAVFFLPVVLALLAAFLLRPLVRAMGRLRIPPFIAAVLIVGALVASVGYGAMQLWDPALEWVRGAPEKLQDLAQKLDVVRRPVQQIGRAAKQVERMTTVAEPGTRAVEVRPAPRLMEWALGSLRDLVVATVVTLMLLVFLLAYGQIFLEKLVRVLPSLSEKKRAVEIAQQIESQVFRYLATVTAINAGLGACVGFAAQLAGLPNPWLWGVLAAVLNFVPYLGATVGIVIVGFVSLVTFPTLGHALVAPLAYLGIATIEGNVVSPIVLGHRFALNPVVIFAWVLFWGWLWGVGGALLAVPLLAVLRILCEHVEGLRPLGEFLGG